MNVDVKEHGEWEEQGDVHALAHLPVFEHQHSWDAHHNNRSAKWETVGFLQIFYGAEGTVSDHAEVSHVEEEEYEYCRLQKLVE